jgi:hypothetical protein
MQLKPRHVAPSVCKWELHSSLLTYSELFILFKFTPRQFIQTYVVLILQERYDWLILAAASQSRYIV